MSSQTWYKGSIYSVLLFRLLVVLVLLLLSRILIYVFNPSQFTNLTLSHFLYICFTGLRFDLFTLIIFNAAVIFLIVIPIPIKNNRIYQGICYSLFYIFNAIALLANFIDVGYVEFTQKRLTFDFFGFVGETGGEMQTLVLDYIIDFWYITLLWIFFVALMVFLSSRFRIDYMKAKRYKPVSYAFDFGRLVVFAALSVLIIRGGFQDKPINLINAGEYTQPKYFPVILNTPFSIIKTMKNTGLKEKHYFDEQELEAIYNPEGSLNNDSIREMNTNVVIIILESFTAEHSAYLNPHLENGNYKGYTPFLDSLMQHSLSFKGFANGEKSMDAIPSILSGIPSMMNRSYLVSSYVGNDVESLASKLKDKGYATAFYHGGTNGTMGFESYSKVAGFDSYYGRTEYDNEDDFDGDWGIFDGPFLQYMANTLNTTPQPFFTTVFTLSSHHPYVLPAGYENRFPKGTLDIHETVAYADDALREFFKTASTMPWFSNTLFVITSDHTFPPYFDEYKTAWGRYCVPIIFYGPSDSFSENSEITVQHIDILPSILDHIGYEGEYFSFGKSVFDKGGSHFAVSYLPTTYQLIMGDYLFKFDGENDLALYNLSNDPLLRENILEKEDSVRNEMSTFTKAIIQQYNNRMRVNRISVK